MSGELRGWYRVGGRRLQFYATDEEIAEWLLEMLPSSGRLTDASIGIVDRLRHEQTGEERHFPEYLRIFERLCRSMRKQLVVETVQRTPDGEAPGVFRMTPGAADAHVRGEITFEVDPVGLRD